MKENYYLVYKETPLGGSMCLIDEYKTEDEANDAVRKAFDGAYYVVSKIIDSDGHLDHIICDNGFRRVFIRCIEIKKESETTKTIYESLKECGLSDNGDSVTYDVFLDRITNASELIVKHRGWVSLNQIVALAGSNQKRKYVGLGWDKTYPPKIKIVFKEDSDYVEFSNLIDLTEEDSADEN